MSAADAEDVSDAGEDGCCVDPECKKGPSPIVYGTGHTARRIVSHYSCPHKTGESLLATRGDTDWPTLLMERPGIHPGDLVKSPHEYVEPTAVFHSKIFQLNFTDGHWKNNLVGRKGSSALSASVGPDDFIRLFSGSSKNLPARARFVPVSIDVLSYQNPLMIPLMLRFTDGARNWLASGTPVGGQTTTRDSVDDKASLFGYPLLPAYAGHVERDSQQAFLVDQATLSNSEIATHTTATRNEMLTAVVNDGGVVQKFARLPAPAATGSAFPKPATNTERALQQAAYLAMYHYTELSEVSDDVLQVNPDTQEVWLKVDKAKMRSLIKGDNTPSMEDHSFIVGGADANKAVLTATIHPSDARGWDVIDAAMKEHISLHAVPLGIPSTITVHLRVSGLFIPLPSQ